MVSRVAKNEPLLAGAGVALAAFLLWKWPPGAAIVVAVGVGVFTLRRWDSAKFKTAPLRDFGWAFLPLLLPVFVVGIAGAIAFPPYVQLPLVLALVLICWRAIIVREWTVEKTKDGLARPVWPGRIELPSWLVGGAIVLLIVVLAVILRPGDGPFEDRQSLILLYATIPFWLAAVVLRAAGFAVTVVKLLVSVVFVAVVFRAASVAGLIPWHEALKDHVPWFSLGNLLIALVALLALAMFGLRNSTQDSEAKAKAEPIPLQRHFVPTGLAGSFSALGLLAAGAASLLLASAALSGAIGQRVHSNQRLETEIPAVDPKPANEIAPAKDSSARTLAEKYQPVLVLAQGEKWTPRPVNDFASEAVLLGRGGVPVVQPDGTPVKVGQDLKSLPTTCAGPISEDCYKLILRGKCDTGDDPCAVDPPPSRGKPDAAAYFRVLRNTPANPDSYAFVGGADYREPAAATSSILIQYWFFYRYNEWKRPVLSGTLAQRHEADWESVMVGLSDETTPKFVAYSEHCGGTWRRWNQIDVAPGQDTRLHPLIAVAKGSHANYVNTDERRSPDWASCGGGGVPKGFLSLLSYASNIRDETSFGRQLGINDLQLIKAATDRPPMSFPGRWGLNDRITLDNELSHQISEGQPPATPAYQSLWKNPLGTVFCSEHWEGPSHGSCKLPTKPLPTG